METNIDVLIAKRRDLKDQIRRISKEINRSKCRCRHPPRKHPRKSPMEMITARRLYARKYYHKRKQMAMNDVLAG